VKIRALIAASGIVVGGLVLRAQNAASPEVPVMLANPSSHLMAHGSSTPATIPDGPIRPSTISSGNGRSCSNFEALPPGCSHIRLCRRMDGARPRGLRRLCLVSHQDSDTGAPVKSRDLSDNKPSL
jgi:hypothetical protein